MEEYENYEAMLERARQLVERWDETPGEAERENSSDPEGDRAPADDRTER